MRARSAVVVLLLAAGCSSGSPAAAPGSASPTASLTASSSPSATAAPTPTRTSAAPSASPSPKPRTRRTSVPVETMGRPAGLRYAFPIRGCSVSYGHSHHDYPATDMFAARGCAIVAVVSGRIDEVSARDVWSASTNRGADRGGLSYSLVGDDGVRYYGSHLSALYVHAGQRVVTGQLIGRVGNSGDARGIATHQHFGISWPTRPGVWWVRRGELYPWPYLDSWRSGGQRSPAAAVAALHRQKGDVPPCSVDC